MSLRIEGLSPATVAGAAACELAAFPHAQVADLLSEEDFAAYLEVFPAGVFVVVDESLPSDDPTGGVVGVGAGILIDFDFDRPQHTIGEVTGEHQCGNHRPDGDWYYGTDLVVRASHRGRGIGRRLYERRKALVIELGRRGIVAGGHLPGFAAVKATMSAEAYVAAVVAGERYDATLTMQLRNGFEVVGVIDDYLDDPSIDNKASLIVWHNPHHPASLPCPP